MGIGVIKCRERNGSIRVTSPRRKKKKNKTKKKRKYVPENSNQRTEPSPKAHLSTLLGNAKYAPNRRQTNLCLCVSYTQLTQKV